MKNLLLLGLILGASITASARPPYLDLLKKSLPQAPFNLACKTCHSGSQFVNPFGRDFSALRSQLGAEFPEKYWSLLKDRDSDGDGMSNINELMAGRNPGIGG